MSDNASKTNPFEGMKINVVADTPAPMTPPPEPNPIAVRRITARLWGEDYVNLRAAVESFANGWTVVEKAEGESLATPASSERSDPAPLDVDRALEVISEEYGWDAEIHVDSPKELADYLVYLYPRLTARAAATEDTA